MITWLQTLIEKRGKWLFIVLLAVVIVSFVPYISPTGSSSLDFFSDDPYSKRDSYFNYDWNDPNDLAELAIAYQASSIFGTVAVPSQDVMDVADQGFQQSLLVAPLGPLMDILSPSTNSFSRRQPLSYKWQSGQACSPATWTSDVSRPPL